MDKSLELGINFFDTADVYGWKKGEGITEQIVGTWFALGGNRRENTIIATKVFGDMDGDANDIDDEARPERRQNSPGVRKQPEEIENRLHRSLPDAPHCAGSAVG